MPRPKEPFLEYEYAWSKPCLKKTGRQETSVVTKHNVLRNNCSCVLQRLCGGLGFAQPPRGLDDDPDTYANHGHSSYEGGTPLRLQRFVCFHCLSVSRSASFFDLPVALGGHSLVCPTSPTYNEPNRDPA